LSKNRVFCYGFYSIHLKAKFTLLKNNMEFQDNLLLFLTFCYFLQHFVNEPPLDIQVSTDSSTEADVEEKETEKVTIVAIF